MASNLAGKATEASEPNNAVMVMNTVFSFYSISVWTQMSLQILVFVLYVHVTAAELLKAPLDITMDLLLQQLNHNFSIRD